MAKKSVKIRDTKQGVEPVSEIRGFKQCLKPFVPFCGYINP